MRFLGILLCSPLLLMANPSEPAVKHGEANFTVDGTHLTINTSEKAIIEWKNFSIDHGETTQFLQPHAQSAVLNRVISSDPSRIFGTLQSNGKVYLINQKGIIVGNSGVVQTGAFFASTLDVLNDDFIAGGDLAFQGRSPSQLINEGRIEALDSDVILIGQFVQNSGEISALNGFCGIGCGEKVLLKEAGVERLFILTPIQTELQVEAGIQNQGAIQALSAELKASGNPYALAVAHEGRIDALGVRKEGGNVFLVAENGNLFISGEVKAEKGTVHLHGDQVILSAHSLVDVSGDNGAGTVYIGKDPLFATEPKAIYVEPNARIHADAKNSGAGGRVLLWADEINSFEGVITAKGGLLDGDGGFVEISSPKSFFPKGKVETTALNGKIGTLLLDPCAVTISMNPTTLTVTPPVYPGMCPMGASSYAFGALAAADILNLDLASYLACNNVTIDASLSGTSMTAGSITVSAPIVWTPSGVPTVTQLHLEADGFITINAEIESQGLAATAAETVIFIKAPTISVDASGIVDVRVIAQSGNITVGETTGLHATTSILVHGSINGADIETNNISSININTHNLTLTAGGGQARIHGEGNVTVNATGNLLMQASASETSINAQTGNYLTSVTVGGSCTLTSTTNFASIYSDGGPTTVNITGDLTLNSGTGGMFPNAAISSASFGGSGDVTVNANNINITGGSALNALALICSGNPLFPGGGGDGKVFVTANGPGGIVLTGGSANNSYASIQAYGSGVGNDIEVTLTHPSANLTMQAAAIAPVTFAGAGISSGNLGLVQGGGNVTINTKNDIIMSAASTDNPAFIYVSHNGMGPKAGNLTALAGNTFNIGNNSIIANYNPTGTLTLVCDNNSPTPPAAGGGNFILASTAAITTASGRDLFIYTSNNLQNTFAMGSLLNASPFLGVTVLVDSAQEQWGVYYPDNPNAVAGNPYTIFYKEGYETAILIPGTQAYNLFRIVVGEPFQDWNTFYDRGIYVIKTIEVQYENMDLDPWYYSYFYQAHRNYNTLKLDHRL